MIVENNCHTDLFRTNVLHFKVKQRAILKNASLLCLQRATLVAHSQRSFKRQSVWLLILFLLLVSCKSKNDAKLYPEYFQLENGLSVFVKEDHKVPLAYIEIAVRAGSVTQRRDNAGIFHLYEHMMYKGNSLCPNSTAVQKAIAKMGIDDYNGTTSEHCVNYFFTIPSDQLKNGMEFWNAAIREPLLNEAEFEDEKKVVISEITAKYNSPGVILGQFFNKTFFPNAPWQLDPSGSAETIQNATLEELKSIKEKYYVPNNAALFIGGDVDTEAVKKLAEEIFGDWQPSDFAFESECTVQNSAPLTETKFFVMPNEQVSPQIVQASIYYRGADADFDKDSTYALDVFTNYISLPKSDFIQTLVADTDLRIISDDYVGGGYSTRRRTGLISFSAVMLDADSSIPSRVKKFYSMVSDEIIENYIGAKNIVPKDEFKKIVQSERDGEIISAEVAESVLANARYWWTVCDVDYYFNYRKNFEKVTNADIASALEKYIQGKSAFVMLSVNPEIYKAQKAEFDAAGFVEVKRENAFWFEE